MLPLKNRLKRRENFFAVSRQGKFVSSGAISVKFLKNREDNARIGFSVGLKFSSKAVERNLIKRKLRMIAAEMLPLIKNKFDIIVMVKKISPKTKNEILKNDLENAMKKGNLIIDKK